MANLLPPNASVLERNLAAAMAAIGDINVPIADLLNPDACPTAALPWLAFALSVDSWDPDWTESQKREAVKASLGVHRIKGTIGAVRKALSALGFRAELQEWFNQIPLGEPYTFRLLLTAEQVGYDKAGLNRLQQLVEATKNLRSHLAGVVPQVVTTAGSVVAGVVGVGNQITVIGGGGDFELLMHAALNGFYETEAAVDSLFAKLGEMTNVDYW